MKYQSLIFLVLIGSNLLIWNAVISHGPKSDLNMYFLDVGQGDSALIELPGGVKILSDGGPPNSVLNPLSKVLAPTDRYIDLLLLSHPQLDHFGGYLSVLKNYNVGAFIYNGRNDPPAAWAELLKIVKEKNIKTVILKEGDKITYRDSNIDIISPNSNFIKSKELNDTVLVALLKSAGTKTLFTGDIGFDVEDYLIKKYPSLDIDILKVGHHGSKFSSGNSFLQKITPKVAVISVSAKNTYGHPTQQALSRLASVGESIYRTDQDGTVHVQANNGKISIYQAKSGLTE